MGAALNESQVYAPDSETMTLVKRHYNTITPENLLKWEQVHPKPGRFHFEPADRYVQFGEDHNMFVVGHTLVWHRQTPEWVFKGENGTTVTCDALLDRLKKHINTVVGRYKGKIDGWDVVNEAFRDDGSFRLSKWYNIIGKGYIEQAFRFAHSADSTAELYYNDYNLWKPGKRAATVDLIKHLQAKNVRIDGVGMQSHLGLEHPSTEQIEKSILAFSELGVEVMISELDINVTRYLVEHRIQIQEQLPDSINQKLADRYVALFDLFNKHRDKLSRVTFWGVNDKQSWLNNWEGSGMRNYPLLFNRENEPKPACEALIKAFSES